MRDSFWFGFLMVVLSFGIFKAESKENVKCKYNHGMKSYSTSNVLNKKTLHRNFEAAGIKYEIHIEDTSNPSEVDDYIVMENSRGHRITFPLECEQ